MKKNKPFGELFYRSLKKTLLTMRIAVILMILGILQANAKDAYSQKTRLSLNFSDAKLVSVLDTIEDESEFYFLYNEKLLDTYRKVSITAKDQLINMILDNLFAGTNVKYTIIDRKIILAPEYLTSEPQQKQITGIVTDKNGAPVPGANVVVTGTTQGTTTDIAGKYNIEVPQGAKSLTFSFIGMEPQEIIIGTLTQINVTMAESAIGLEEVVVIGYGTAKKTDLTGSVTSLQGDLLSQRHTIKVTDALQGAISGITVTRTSGAPGTDAQILIRGVTTIGTSDPLVIVDGIQGSISNVNPNDVENISVLKDAAAASIYGSKAAAGVILITTKRGKSGQTNLDYNFEYGLATPTRLPKYLSAVPYMKLNNELLWNDNNNLGSEYSYYAQDLIENYTTLHAENPDLYPDTDWSIYLNDYAPSQRHFLSFTSGEKNLQTQVSLSFDKMGGLTDGRSYERITARANNDLTINKVLSAHFDLQFLNIYDEHENTTLTPFILKTDPTYEALYSDGRVAYVRNGESPWAFLMRGGTNKAWTNLITGKLSLEFTPIKGLKISGVVAPSYNFYKNKVHVLQTTMTALDDPTLILGLVLGGETTKLTEYRNDDKSLTTQFLTNYSNTLGNHNINLLVGYENYYSFNENLSASRDQYKLNTYPYLNIGPLDYRNNSGNAMEYASRSYFGRVIYSYKTKYLFQTNVRIDGSSRFYKDNRWGVFPSFSAGWVLSEESFMKGVPVISFLKLRASWGGLGNERIGNNYPYQSTVAFSDALFYQGSTIISNQTAYLLQYAIQDISWETTESDNFGFNANFFEDKLQVTADIFHKTTKNMLLAIEIPDFIGFGNPTQNTGKMYTNGWELEIRYSNKIRDLNYSVSGNVFDSRSIMGDLGGTEFLGNQVKFKGSEFNEWYGYISEGLYQTNEEVNNSAKLISNVKPGDVKYKDISGPDGVPDGIISSAYDRVLLGGSLPRYQYGGNINLDYKNFNISLIFQGVGKEYSYMNTIMTQPVRGFPALILGNYWSKYNTDEQNRKVFYPRLSSISSGGVTPANGNNYVISDYWLFNGRYFRLKNIVLGYSLSKPIVEKLKIQNLRVYINLSDLFSIDKFPEGWDPEASSSGSFVTSSPAGYFITKSYIFGISAKF